jgi:hypothetical protein
MCHTLKATIWTMVVFYRGERVYERAKSLASCRGRRIGFMPKAILIIATEKEPETNPEEWKLLTSGGWRE